MSHAARKTAAANSHHESASAPAVSRRQRSNVFLVTQDESLWPLLGNGLGRDWVLKQVDTIGELLATVDAAQSGIVVWDARGAADHAADLSRLQLHSERFVIIVIDAASNSETWRVAVQQRQIVALLGVPFKAEQWREALSSAREECQARIAVLGDSGAPAAAPAPRETQPGRRRPRYAVWIIAALCLASGAGYLLYRGTEDRAVSTPPSLTAAPAQIKAPSAKAAPATDEQVDALLENARQAMLDRHFIEPADGNALAIYKSVLMLDPGNGEAKQGLQRLAQILFARAQSDLGERKFDMALQALETARSISPEDPRLADLDARVEALRAELGSTQIQAALNAGNFVRATELLDEAVRAKSMGVAQTAQLREEIRRRSVKADVEHFVSLLTTRLQQDRLLDPHNDSAVYYLQQAREAGAGAADLQEQMDELSAKLLRAARVALDESRLGDVDRLLNAARNTGAAPAAIAGLQRDLDGARDGQARGRALQSKNLELAQTRLALGQLVEPDNDSALYYVNQLRASDPANSAWAPIAGAVQSAIIAKARAALDSGDTAKAESLARLAGGLGATSALDELTQALAQQQSRLSAPAAVAPTTLVVVKPLRLDYPRSALADGTEGWVDLAFDVTTEGKVANATVVNASPPKVFDSAAKSAVSRMRFQPVMRNGEAISFRSTLHVVFRLEQQ
ncbi:MAG: TonB family protein [Steroidobacteraceae bacterium]